MKVRLFAFLTLVLATIVAVPAHAQQVVAKVAETTITGTATSAAVLVSNDVSGYGSASFQFTSVGSGNTISIEESSDGTNWVAGFGTRTDAAYSGIAYTIPSPNTAANWNARLLKKYWRLRVSTYGSGTVTVTVTYKAQALTNYVVLDFSNATIGTVGGIRSAATDRSSTITTGGTSQQVMASNTARRGLFCQNIDTAIVEDMWVNFGSAAAANTAGSMRLGPGASMTWDGMWIPTDAVNVIAATTGHRFTCKEG